MRVSAAAPAADPQARDQLVLAHVGLVKSLAHRLRRRLPAQVELAELVSVGVLGLIEAATRFQPSLGVPFDAFARQRIHGAMLDALRSLDTVPRSVRRLQRQAEAAIGQLRHRLGREPETAEIAAALGVSAAQYEHMLDEMRQIELAVVRRTSAADAAASLVDLAIDPEAGPYVQLERSELRTRLAAALAELPERERHILALSYEDELTLAEIGAVIGVSESRVSQLRTQAIARLRSILRVWLADREAH
jgi:RNA polymerase sigma factor for flagellar operon FliA